VGYWRKTLVKDGLGNSRAVTKVEKDEVPVIAATIHPTHESDSFADVSGAEISTHMGTLQSA
jgi:hypothetical protein